MPAYRLTQALVFPPPEGATREGLVAIGGDYRPERLLLAYGQGIFPWPHQGYPPLWFSPDPRFVLQPAEAHVGRSLRKQIQRGLYEVRTDTAFERVMRACAAQPRPGQDGTWIDDALIEGFVALHARGLAHSIESWKDGALVGGLYGISLGGAFFGESMFAHAPDASKVAFATALGNFRAWGMHFVDCQVYTDHLARFGAKKWPRRRYLTALHAAISEPTRLGPWVFSLSAGDALAQLRTDAP